MMDDLRSPLANRVQLTTDGHKAYLEAVEGASPAMAAGITDKLWSLEGVSERIEARQAKPMKHGRYKKVSA